MGFGDEIMATGMARGAKDRGKRIAFGDGRRIIWGPMCAEVFRNNPNIAMPGSERVGDIEWIKFFKGARGYVKASGNRWLWDLNFRAMPGEMFFDDEEIDAAKRAGEGFILIEPNVPPRKLQAVNKDWGFQKYQAVADHLQSRGHDIVQFVPRETDAARRLRGVRQVQTTSFRDAVAIMGRARLYIGAEGGLHHAAAAMKVPGVVIFGGFIPPQVTGYDGHTNLTGGATACGKLKPCGHCRGAMEAISVDQVYAAALGYLKHG